MPQLELLPSQESIEHSQEALKANEYPGRVLIQGLNAHGNMALQVYALMGRSEGSRDRIFVEEEHGIRAVAPNKTEEEMRETENSALIYYSAMADRGGVHVVSNGAQTDHVLRTLADDKHVDLLSAVQSAPTVDGVDLSIFEPDSPNNTPRITGVINLNAGAADCFAIATVRKEPGSDVPIYSTFQTLGQAPVSIAVKLGTGFGVQTYNGNGSPLPSFDSEPYPVALGEGVEDTANAIWDLLNPDNRVALVAKGISLLRPQAEDSDPLQHHIINARG